MDSRAGRLWAGIVSGCAGLLRPSSRGHVGDELQLWRVELVSPYAPAMRSELGAIVDRRLTELIIVRLRRSWPALKLLPTVCIAPIVVPVARRLRRSLLRGAIAVAVFAGVLIAIFAVWT
jgi:hypothetical protein